MKGSMLKVLMSLRFKDMKFFNLENTFGTLKSGGNWIESIVSMTDCSALLVVAVHTVLAVAAGQRLSATRTVLYLCVVKSKT